MTFEHRIAAVVIAALIPACSTSSGPEPQKLSVAGTYSTAVSMSENSCGNTVSISPLPTIVAHTAGAAAIGLTHGISHTGTVAANGSFTTQPTVINDPSSGGVQSTITIAGQFNLTGFIADASVDVVQAQQPTTCRYKVHWIGTKQGAPNVIP